jgi:hypothetical protein
VGLKEVKAQSKMNQQLAELLIRAAFGQNGTPKEIGQNIVVLDRGFVYVGDVCDEGDYVIIRNARNIRVWGTTAGLGELRNGPLANTKLDIVGEVKATKHSLQHFIPCKGF